jgi:hypothetical protein
MDLRALRPFDRAHLWQRALSRALRLERRGLPQATGVGVPPASPARKPSQLPKRSANQGRFCCESQARTSPALRSGGNTG